MTTKRTDGATERMERERAALDLWDGLRGATTMLRTRLAEFLDAELGIQPEEADLLGRLGEAPEQRLRMADISRSLHLSKSGVTRLVDRLAERGLVVCAPPARATAASCTQDLQARAGGRPRPLLRPWRPAWRSSSPAVSHPKTSTG
jgi:AraC-like DNA-binding protein